ncbi:hypothetical protein [Agrobacterium bohemicum]|uniref:hypothetical protein n=1 Tax=Agrobacterium bohemicum TaxID=2052828 RepID=UPI000AA1B996|nr:hypothetical protein [Agrobacterium bohemicum]
MTFYSPIVAVESIQFKPVGYDSILVRIWQITAQGACTRPPVGSYPHEMKDVAIRIDLNHKRGQHLDYDAHCTLGKLVICSEGKEDR